MTNHFNLLVLLILGHAFSCPKIFAQNISFELKKNAESYGRTSACRSENGSISLMAMQVYSSCFELLECNLETKEKRTIKLEIPQRFYKELLDKRENNIPNFYKDDTSIYLIMGEYIVYFKRLKNKFIYQTHAFLNTTYDKIFKTKQGLVLTSIYPRIEEASSKITVFSFNLKILNSLENYFAYPIAGYFVPVKYHSIYKEKLYVSEYINPKWKEYDVLTLTEKDSFKVTIPDYVPISADTIAKINMQAIPYHPMTFINPFMDYANSCHEMRKSYITDSSAVFIIKPPKEPNKIYKFQLQKDGIYKLEKTIQVSQIVAEQMKLKYSTGLSFPTLDNKNIIMTDLIKKGKRWHLDIYSFPL